MRLLLTTLLVCLAPLPAFTQEAGNTDVRECLAFQTRDWDISDGDKFQRDLITWRKTCQRALTAEPQNIKITSSLASAWSSAGFKNISLPLTRAAAAKDDAEANFELYTQHYSFSRRFGRDPYVQREEGEHALRRAAELGHAEAARTLTLLLDRGTLVKRDLKEAALWAERATKNPPKDLSPADMQVMLGRILARLDDPAERKRGFDLLASLNRADASSAFAGAIRESDPQRARKIYEELYSAKSGIADADLADMLIKGEGGPADPQRALKMLQKTSFFGDTPVLKAHYGRLLMEGKFVPADPQKGIELMSYMTQWSVDWRHEVMNLLAMGPALRLSYPDGVYYDAYEAIELGEPGAFAALVNLKLSANEQFRDPEGACELVEWGVQEGLEEAKARLPECSVEPKAVH